MSKLIEQLKRERNDPRSVADITLDVGDELIKLGKKDVLDADPEFADEYFNLKKVFRPSVGAEFGRAISAGFLDRLPGAAFDTGAALATMASKVAPPAYPGTELGAPSFIEENIAAPLRKQAARERAEGDERRGEVSVQGIENIRDAGDFGRWALMSVGENIPQLAPSVAAAFIPGGQAASASNLMRMGAPLVRAALPAAVMNIGEQYSQLPEEQQKDPRAAAIAVVGGTIAGFMDAAGVLLPLAKFLPGANLASQTKILDKVFNRGGIRGFFTGAIADAPVEGLTEMAQEAVAIAGYEMATGEKLPDDVVKSRLQNALAGGAVVGAPLGGLAGAFRAERPAAPQVPAAAPVAAPSAPVAPAPRPSVVPPVAPAPQMVDLEELRNARVGSRMPYQAPIETQLESELAGAKPPMRLGIPNRDAIEAGLSAIEAEDVASAADLADLAATAPSVPRRLGVPNAEAIERGLQAYDTPESIRTRAFAETPLLEGADVVLPDKFNLTKPLLSDVKDDIQRAFFRAQAQDVTTVREVADEAIRSGKIYTPAQLNELDDAHMAINRQRPVKVDVIERYQLESALPEGYVKKGNTYFFKPKEAVRAVQEQVTSSVPAPKLPGSVSEVAAQIRETAKKPAEKEAPKLEIQYALAPVIKGARRIPKAYGGGPLVIREFGPEDGDNSFRIKEAAGGGRIEKASGNSTSKAVLLLDKATGQLHVRGIVSGEKEGVGSSIRIHDAAGRGLDSRERVVDLSSPTESATWDMLAAETFRGKPRFEVIGWGLYDTPRNLISYSFENIAAAQANPQISQAIKRYYQGGETPEIDATIQALRYNFPESGSRKGSGAASRGTFPSSVLPEAPGNVPVNPGAGVGQEESVREGRVDVVPQNAPDAPGTARGIEVRGATAAEQILAHFPANTELVDLLKRNASEKKIRAAVMRILKENARKRKVRVSSNEMDAMATVLTQQIRDNPDALAYTIHAPQSYLLSSPQQVAVFNGALSAMRAAGVDVALFQQNALSEYEAVRRGFGITTGGEGKAKAFVGLVGNFLQDTPNVDDVVKTLHEAAHVFVEKAGLSESDASMFMDAMGKLVSQKQNYLVSPFTADIRILVATPQEHLTQAQRELLSRATPAQIQEALETPPEELLRERVIDHLGILGMNEQTASGLFDQTVRFLKELYHRIAMVVQKMLKGESAVNPELVRAYVENKWLQWLNQDFAAGNASIGMKLSQWIGAPTTRAERLPLYTSLDGYALNYTYDPDTGVKIVADVATDDSDAMRDQLSRVFQLVEARKTLPKDVALTMRIAESLDPTIEANTQYASVNFEDSVYQGVFNSPEIRPYLPGSYSFEEFQKNFLSLWKARSPAAKKAAIAEEAARAKVTADASTQINSLPVTEDGSSAQQKAVRNTIINLRATEQLIVRKMSNMLKRRDDLKARKRVLADVEKRELDRINTTVPIFERVLNVKDSGIRDQIARLESKLDVGLMWDAIPGSSFLVAPAPTSGAEAVKASRTGKIPTNLLFDTPARREFLKAIAANQKWLDNEANKKTGALYGQMAMQQRKLVTIATASAYSANTFRLRNAFFDSLRNTMRAVGTPVSKDIASTFDRFEASLLRWVTPMTAKGVEWSKAYAEFKGAVGWTNKTGTDEEFRRAWWNPVMAYAEDVPDGTTDPDGVVIRALKDFSRKELSPKGESALRTLLRITRENNKMIVETFDSFGLKVQDRKLGREGDDIIQRGLIRQGYITGRRQTSEQVERIVSQMRTKWSNTEAHDFFEQVAELYDKDPQSFVAQTQEFFPASVMKSFVEPLVYTNRQLFVGVTQAGSAPQFASLSNVREAYDNSGGDILAFLSNLNRLEGGNDTTLPEFTERNFQVLRRMYGKLVGVANSRQQARSSGIETLPREIMDSRQADDFPPAWIDYSLYDQGSNKVLLFKLALNHAFGRNGLTNGEFSRKLDALRTELEGLRADLDSLVVTQEMTHEEARKVMGEDRYTIARQAKDHLQMLDKFKSKMEMMTESTGELLGDFKAFDELLGLNAMMILQNPRSALVNTLDILGPFYRTKFSATTFNALKSAASRLGADVWGSLMESMGIHVFNKSELAARMKRLGLTDPALYVSYRDAWNSEFGTGNRLLPEEGDETTLSRARRNTILTARRMKNIADMGVAEVTDAALRSVSLGKISLGDKALKPGDENIRPKLRLFGIFKTVGNALSNAAVEGQYNVFADVVSRGLEYINQSPNPQLTAQKMAAGDIQLAPEDLGYTRSWMFLNDKSAFDYLKVSVAEKMDQGSLERMIADAYARTQANPSEPLITDQQFIRIAHLALTEIQLNSNTANTPIDLKGNGLWRTLSPFLTWPYLAMLRLPDTFKDASGRYTKDAIVDGFTTIFMGAVPLTLAASMMIDWYDEEIAGKRSNLRELDATSVIPGVGPVAQPMATLERLARYGGGGLATEILNGMFNMDDARGGISADTRILLFSQFKNFKDITNNLWSTDGNVTYAGVVRPFMQFLGLSGAIQYQQILNKQLGLSNDEAAINERINVGNYLRAAGRDVGLPVRVGRSQASQPTPLTPFIQQMELAAYKDDSGGFREAFRDAVRQLRQMNPEEPDPAREVARAFAQRHPMRRVFTVAPSQHDYRKLIDDLNPTGREAVESAVKLFNKYMLRAGARPYETKSDRTPEAVTKKMLTPMKIREAQIRAAHAAYAGSFGF